MGLKVESPEERRETAAFGPAALLSETPILFEAAFGPGAAGPFRPRLEDLFYGGCQLLLIGDI
ncbi:MAG: hypothetical protein AAGU11_21920, partial [Syntrophobacteraceae bacterium]